MGFTLDDAFINCGETYKMNLLAGKEGCANALSWVHLVEDYTTIQQFAGKELAVTTGLGFQNEDALFKFINQLIKHHCAGVIINTGMYILTISQELIVYCDENNFPLITIPWDINLSEVVKEFCMRIFYSEREDHNISKYFINSFINPEYIETARNELVAHFDVDGYFQVVAIDIEGSELLDQIDISRLSMQIQLYLDKISGKYSFFYLDTNFILVVNNVHEDDLIETIEKMINRVHKKLPDKIIHIGIGTQFKDFFNVIRSYQRSQSALKNSSIFECTLSHFDDMGINQILLSINDQQILENLYKEKLQILNDYDTKHNTELEKTLYYYLRYNGSPQKIASELYTHRNTITYRISKIKELLDTDLENYEERSEYMMAYYIKDIIHHKKEL